MEVILELANKDKEERYQNNTYGNGNDHSEAVVVGAFLQEAIDVVSILWALTALIDRD